MSRSDTVKVAIIGGGCASIATAFELTRPEHEGRYQVTVYQLGWRLGGKGASGRGAAGRIEEHGLHLWLGYYENAFRLMRECYAELARDPASCHIASWRDAFFTDPNVALTERLPGGDWSTWIAHFPPGAGEPGDSLERDNPFTVSGYMVRTAELAIGLLRSVQERTGNGAQERASRAGGEPPGPEGVADAILKLLRAGQLATLTAMVEGASLLRTVLTVLPGVPGEIVVRLIDAIVGGIRAALEASLDSDTELRRIWTVLDLVLACLKGSVRFGLATDPRGFDAVDDYEMRDWLRLNGASETTLDSPFVQGLYDLALAYEDGDTDRPALAASVGLRSSTRMFYTYRGALFWKMRAGMGDVVFAPFFEVLRNRGVRFEFFHRLENVRLADRSRLADGQRPYVEALQFAIQARPKGDEYDPLVTVRGLPCWPSEPRYEKLRDGARLKRDGREFESHWDRRRVGRKTLRVTRDFDCVVLGLSIGAIPFVCRELVAADPRWRAMVGHVKTVATQAFQIWLHEDMERLGWQGPPVNLSSFVHPFDTWADMRQLIEMEDWRQTPRAIAYFCSVLPTPQAEPVRGRRYPERQRRQVRENAVRFLDEEIRHLWPRAAQGDGFRWDLLIDPAERPKRARRAKADDSRFDSQFWVANINPSDRFVLSLPGSSRYRISPLDGTYANLTIAGDWTECGHNIGCVESAIMSGRLAAHSISKRPALDDIIGYNHP